MGFNGKTVYVANARTNKVDTWQCIGEFSRTENGKVRERYCFLTGRKGLAALPKRCVFETREAAKAALEKKAASEK